MAKPARGSKYVKRLRQFLKSQGSPLAKYATLIAQMESKHGIPAGMIAGIAGAETSFGKAGKGPSINNFWGWMDSRGPPYQRSFKSIPAAIRQYASFLGTNYIKAGYNTPEKMARRYVGYASPNWLNNVNSTLRSLGTGGAAPPAAPGGTTTTTTGPKPGKTETGGIFGSMSKGQKIALAMMLSSTDDDSRDFSLPLMLLMMGKGGATAPTKPGKAQPQAAPGAQMFSGRGLQLPTNHASSHPTSGLGGYPAFDFMQAAGTPVYSPISGSIVKLSGHPGVSGSTFGRSIYVKGQPGTTFLTHFDWDRTLVKVGDTVKKGQLLGYVGDWGPRSHIHMGATWW